MGREWSHHRGKQSWDWRETEVTIYECLDLAMPEMRYHPRTYQYVPCFILLQAEFFGFFCLFCFSLPFVSGKDQTNKFSHLQTPREAWRLLFAPPPQKSNGLLGKTFSTPVFLPTLGFSEVWGREWKAKMWEVTVLPASRLSEPLPANYTTRFGSRAPFIKLLGVLEG